MFLRVNWLLSVIWVVTTPIIRCCVRGLELSSQLYDFLLLAASLIMYLLLPSCSLKFWDGACSPCFSHINCFLHIQRKLSSFAKTLSKLGKGSPLSKGVKSCHHMCTTKTNTTSMKSSSLVKVEVLIKWLWNLHHCCSDSYCFWTNCSFHREFVSQASHLPFMMKQVLGDFVARVSHCHSGPLSTLVQLATGKMKCDGCDTFKHFWW